MDVKPYNIFHQNNNLESLYFDTIYTNQKNIKTIIYGKEVVDSDKRNVHFWYRHRQCTVYIYLKEDSTPKI